MLIVKFAVPSVEALKSAVTVTMSATGDEIEYEVSCALASVARFPIVPESYWTVTSWRGGCSEDGVQFLVRAVSVLREHA
jgi:hypothetical protein